MATEAELRRRDQSGILVDWALVTDPSSATGFADPTSDEGARDLLTSLLAELGQKLEAGQQVDLLPATITLLRDVTAAVTGTVDVGNFPVSQTVDGTVTVANPTADPETGLAKDTTVAAVLAQLDDATTDTVLSVLKAISTELASKYEGGAIALDAATLAALEQITATVANFPATYPLPAAQVQTDALTDTQLRAAALTVDTGLAQPVQDGGSVQISNDPAAIALQASTATLTSAAPLTITPAAGNALRLWWVLVIPDPDNSSTGSAQVAIGPTEVYRAPALAHRQRFDGAANQSITVTIVGNGTFDTTVHYEEYLP